MPRCAVPRPCRRLGMSRIFTDSLENTQSLLCGHMDTHLRCLLLSPAQPELPQPLWNAWHGLGMQRENDLCSHHGVQQLLCQGDTERGPWSSCQRLQGRDLPVPPGPHTCPGFAHGMRSGGCHQLPTDPAAQGSIPGAGGPNLSTACTARH